MDLAHQNAGSRQNASLTGYIDRDQTMISRSVRGIYGYTSLNLPFRQKKRWLTNGSRYTIFGEAQLLTTSLRRHWNDVHIQVADGHGGVPSHWNCISMHKTSLMGDIFDERHHAYGSCFDPWHVLLRNGLVYYWKHRRFTLVAHCHLRLPGIWTPGETCKSWPEVQITFGRARTTSLLRTTNRHLIRKHICF